MTRIWDSGALNSTAQFWFFVVEQKAGIIQRDIKNSLGNMCLHTHCVSVFLSLSNTKQIPGAFGPLWQIYLTGSDENPLMSL